MSFNTKKIILIFLFLLYLSSITRVLGNLVNSQVYLQPQHQMDITKCFQKISNSYTDHDPINVVGNASFNTEGFTGKGTTNDPYIFENYNITSNTEHLIVIRDTTAYFIIQNNYLDGINKDRTGIYLDNVTNGIVEINTIINTGQAILVVMSSYNNVITNNTIKDNQDGIEASSSFNSTYTYNKIFNNSHGIAIVGSNNLVMSNSVVNYLWGGIFFGSGENNTIYNNSIMDNKGEPGVAAIGVYLLSSYSNITSNTIQNNWRGIELEGSTNNVSKNIIGQNNASIEIKGSNHSITENVIYNTSDVGIELDASGVIVKWNDFICNELDKDSQAVAEVGNYFSENYWDDWTCPDADADGIVDNPYPIQFQGAGPSFGVLITDASPLTSPHNDIPLHLHLLSRPRIIFPTSEATGTITVKWCSVTDFSGHSVSYTLYYNEPYGNWIELASGLTEAEYKWDTSTLERYSSYRLRFVAECSEGLTSEHSLYQVFHFEKPAHGWSFATLTLTLCLLVFASRRKKSK